MSKACVMNTKVKNKNAHESIKMSENHGIPLPSLTTENSPHVPNNDLHWKDDGPDNNSTVDDSWPSESSPQFCQRKASKIITFAHEEFPLERPPINCRMLYDTVPIATKNNHDHDVEKNAPIHDFCSRMMLSALNTPRFRCHTIVPLPLSRRSSTSPSPTPTTTKMIMTQPTTQPNNNSNKTVDTADGGLP